MARIISLPFSSTSNTTRAIPDPIRRLRTYILRLPFFTRLTLLIIILFWTLELQTVWPVIEWGSLNPEKIGIRTGGMYRLNTYPFIHLGLWHMILDTVCVVPLMERFEAEWGTLTTLALFMGPFATFPAGLYILITSGVWGLNEPIVGSSIWVFLLLANESIKQWRISPRIQILSVELPTYLPPILFLIITVLIFSNSSFMGHICGLAIGYLWGLKYLKFLAPPEKVLRWIEDKLNLLGRLPHYVSVDQKTYGRYGVLPTTINTPGGSSSSNTAGSGGTVLGSNDDNNGNDTTGGGGNNNNGIGIIGMNWLNGSGSKVPTGKKSPVLSPSTEAGPVG